MIRLCALWLIFSERVKALGCHLRMHGVKFIVIPVDVWDVHIHNNANSDTLILPNK